MGLFTTFKEFGGAIANAFKGSVNSYCFLETTDGESSLVAKDGSLCTVLRVNGARQVMGQEEMERLVETLSISLSSTMGKSGHAIQVWFARDPDLSPQLVRQMLQQARTTAQRLHLSLDDLLQERERHLPRFITWEGFYIALWTRLTVLTPQEVQNLKKDLKTPVGWPAMSDTQNVFKLGAQVAIRHRSFVSGFVSDLNAVHIRADILDGHAALQAVKSSIYPDMVGSNWRPRLPGDPPYPRFPEHGGGDYSHLMWPRLDSQLFNTEAEVVNQRIVRVGAYNFASVSMTVGPQELQDFSHLMGRIRDQGEFPWRVSFLIEGDGLGSGMALKSGLAGVFGITNTTDNKPIREAVRILQEVKTNGSVIVRLRVSFSTWAPADLGLRLIEERISRLQRAVVGWGYCDVSPTSGDPLAGTLSSALALDVASTAPSGAPVLKDVLYMLPWNRDASPWPHGPVLFRTVDGRPWPYMPASNLQTGFVDLIFAPPGYGKSVLLNTTSLALCLSPSATSGTGGAMLPRLAIIDIGASSSGLINLLKEALPPNRRHEVQHRRLQMIPEHAINPFDTQLGFRHPTTVEKAFLINFVTLLGTPVGETKPPSSLSELVAAAIDLLYSEYDDQNRKGQPKRYQSHQDVAVDEAIVAHGIRIEEGETTWWSVTDALFEKGAVHEATLAQRFAVPRLDDMNIIIRKPQIESRYSKATMPNSQETVLDVLSRMISSAIGAYPILKSETRFDIGDSRVVALDLDMAAPKGGAAADKQTAMVYMLARFILAKDFYIGDDILPACPASYLDHHKARIRRVKETPKRLVMDEFHRTRSAQAVRDQVVVDMREGRKYGVAVSLVSQLLEDFDTDMIELATAVWVLGVNTPRAAEDARKIFDLSPTATDIVKNYLRGPGPGGAPFLVILTLKDGRHEHLLVNTLGPTEMWAFSTTAQDAVIRNKLYEVLGPVEARRRLARRFPRGTAKGEIERREAALAEMGDSSDEAKDGLVEQIIQELLADPAA
jgi:intracellular multiplication protein IcmB